MYFIREDNSPLGDGYGVQAPDEIERHEVDHPDALLLDQGLDLFYSLGFHGAPLRFTG